MPTNTLPSIPGWTPPLDTGQPSAGDLNDLSLMPKATFAARNTIIPISYGRDRFFGKLCVVHVDEDNGFLYVAYSFCQGEIQGFETVFVDGVDVNDGTDGFLTFTDAAVELHTGTPTQTVSTLLSGVLTGYTDTLLNTAYVVLKVPQGSTRGFPRVEAILQGRKVYDPRLDTTRTDITPVGSGSHREDDPATWEFSTNPTICFRDMVVNFTGWEILDQGVVDSADYNDETISSVKRREIGLTLGRANKVEQWATGFRTYMGAFLGWEEGKLRVIPNKVEATPAGVVLDLTADDIVKDSLRLTRRSLRSVPNSVAVDYEDSSGSKWHTERVQADSARVSGGQEARRLSRISLPGIHNASQAQREATERLNWYLTDLEAVVTIFDQGWRVQNGSIVTITHPIGLDAKLFRVRRTTALKGRWVLDLVEYDPAIYSTEVIADPTTPDTSLGNPLSPPLVADLSVAEELFHYRSGVTGSRVRVTWTATSYPFLSQYLVEGYVGGALVWQSFTGANDVVSPGVEELVDATIPPTAVEYDVKVYVLSPFAQGDAATDSLSILGKLAIPGDVPSLIATQVGSGQVALSWEDAVDIDIWRYELRQGTPSDTWATATKIDLLDGTDRAVTDLSLGAYRWFVKAIDSVRQESAIAAFADVTLIAPTAVTSLTGFEVASEVRLSWPAVVGEYVERYRVSYDTVTPSSEITLDVVDTLRFQTKDVPEGTWVFSVWSRDANGNEAATAASVTVEVTSDADAFLADSHTFINPSLTNMVEWFERIDPRQFYVTNMADTFAVTPTDFVAGVPLANYHSTGASEWLSETKDFGLSLTGNWQLTHDVTALEGNVQVDLELTNEETPTTWIVFTGGSAKGAFRHARVRVTTTNPPGTATAFVKSPLMDLKINVVPLEESGSGTSSGTEGVGSTVQLEREYTALKEIMAQPKNTQDGVTATVDNIVVGPNTAIQGDGTNYLHGGDIAAFDFGATQDFSYEFFIKNTATATVMRLLGKLGTAGWRIDLAASDALSVLVDDGPNVIALGSAGTIPNDGSYYHVAVTVDRTGDQMRLYINGVEDSNSPADISTVTGALDAGATIFTIFSTPGPSYQFDGMLDEVRVWDDVRSGAEILANMQQEVDPASANLIAYWKMDGSVSTSVGATVLDETTNNYDLTNTGAGDLIYVDPGDSGNEIQKINSFDVYIFDIFGQQLAEAYQWRWKGV